MRHVPSMMHAIDMHSRDSPKQENEDVFYVLSFIDEDIPIAPLGKAADFALEILCPDIHEHLVFIQNVRNTKITNVSEIKKQKQNRGGGIFDAIAEEVCKQKRKNKHDTSADQQ